MFVGKEDFRFEVSNDLGFLHPSEYAIVNQILEIGTYYKKITHFCNTYDIVRVHADKDHRCGLYLSSLAAALNRTTHAFHTTVVELELKLLNDPHLPLSELLLTLQPMAPLLATLSSLVTQIEEKNIHGCMILEVLHKHTANSVSHVRQVLMRIEQEVHTVLYDQLTHWLLHGLLLDPHHELFIHSITSTKATDEMLQMDALSLEESENSVLHPECTLRLDMLPSHIPLTVAEKILFIGECILVFEREARKDSEIVDMAAVSSHNGQVLKSREEEFKGLIHALGQEPTFSIIQFSQVIETIRHCVSEELWKLVMEAGLIAELGDLKAVFLLGRGELYQTLIPSITPFLRKSSSPVANFDGLFQLAGRQVLLEDGMLEKFTLSLKTQMPLQPSQTKVQPDKSWQNLRLDYHAKWPLYKLFTPAVQDKYNAIFTFLLDVRRAQYRLQQLWITQMRTKFHRKSEMDRLQWTLRHHMSLLIDNIQYYLQVDVLESQHWQLVTEIQKTQDYQHLARAHHNFLVSISAQCFLNNTVVSGSLQQLLKFVHKFCTILENTYSNESKDVRSVSTLGTKPTLLSDIDQIKELSEAFERAAAQLFIVLSNLRLHQGSQHTSQLIMRIDYNKYYSKNTTVRRFKSPLDAL